LPSPAGLTRGSMDRRVKPGDDESGWVNLIEPALTELRPVGGYGKAKQLESFG
jgi:hypothetical protein